MHKRRNPQLSDQLNSEKPILHQGLRSNYDENKYIVPRVKNKTFAERSFSVAGQKLLIHICIRM